MHPRTEITCTSQIRYNFKYGGGAAGTAASILAFLHLYLGM